MSHSRLLEDLIQISLTSKEIIQATPALGQEFRLFETCPPPVLVLPSPKHLSEELLGKEVPLEFVEKLSQLYSKTVDSFQRRLRSVFAETWTKINSLPRHEHMLTLDEFGKQFAKTIESYYVSRVNKWREGLKGRISSHLTSRWTKQKDTKKYGDGRNQRNLSFNYVGYLSLYNSCI